MATEASSGAPGAGQQAFTLYAAQGRVYASNVDQKLIDLGALTQDGSGFAYRLDGNSLSRGGFADARAALAHLAGRLRFLFLDGQFTALVDERGSGGPELAQAPRLDIVLDELPPGERIQDAGV